MKKKALQVVNIPFVLPYYFGDQIDFLKRNGLDLTVACSPGPELDRFCEKYTIKKAPIEVLRKIDIKKDVLSLIKLISLIRTEKFDYVIGHTPKGALLAMLAARVVGVKNRVYFRHGIVYETSTGFKRKLMLFLERLTSACATKIVSVSKSVHQYSIDAKINSTYKSILLNKGTCNGVDIKRFTKNVADFSRQLIGLGEKDYVIGYVGRLVNDKGIKELIDAWDLVKSRIPNGKLLLVGPFEQRDSLPMSVQQYVLNEPSVIYTDLVDDTVPFYNAMDVFILPSYREGFPTVVLEASSMELPVITTRSTGCIDSIIENETGVYSDINGTDLAEKIIFYYENPKTRTAHGRNGRKWVEQNFDQEVVWRCIKDRIFN